MRTPTFTMETAKYEAPQQPEQQQPEQQQAGLHTSNGAPAEPPEQTRSASTKDPQFQQQTKALESVKGTGGSAPKPSPAKKSRRHKAAPPSSGEESDGGEHSGRLRHRKEKTGHRTVNTITGEVKYKKVKSTELMAAIQMGMRQAIGYTMQKKKRDILMQDFQEVESLYYPREGTTSTPPHKFENFKFYTYAPRAYRHFREIFGIDTADFLLSMCDDPLRELSNPGASGSLFWLSHDDQFIVKTIQKGEHKFLMKLLPQYYLNLHQNKRTLLPKFFAHFCYKSSTGRHIRFIVMNNILPSHLTYHERYDLKGSTKGRLASPREREKKSPTLKDLDFNQIHEKGITLPRRTYDRLCNTLHRDCLILRSYKIMDYSLLLGIHNITQAKRDKTSAISSESAHQLTVSSHAAQQQFPHTIEVVGAPADSEHLNGTYLPLSSTTDTKWLHYKKEGEGGNNLFLSFSPSEDSWIISSDPSGFDALAVLPTLNPMPVTEDGLKWQLSGKGSESAPDMKSIKGRRTHLKATHRDSSGSSSSLKRRMSLTYQLDEEDLAEQEEQVEGGLIAYNEKGEKLLVFLGIIDILQSYGMRKKLEHTYKSVVFDGDTVSVHRPGFYQKRFQDYMTLRVFKPPEGESGPSSSLEESAASQAYRRRGRPSMRSRTLAHASLDDSTEEQQHAPRHRRSQQQKLQAEQPQDDDDEEEAGAEGEERGGGGNEHEAKQRRSESPRVAGVHLMSDDDVRRSRETSPRTRRRHISSSAVVGDMNEDDAGADQQQQRSDQQQQQQQQQKRVYFADEKKEDALLAREAAAHVSDKKDGADDTAAVQLAESDGSSVEVTNGAQSATVSGKDAGERERAEGADVAVELAVPNKDDNAQGVGDKDGTGAAAGEQGDGEDDENNDNDDNDDNDTSHDDSDADADADDDSVEVFDGEVESPGERSELRRDVSIDVDTAEEARPSSSHRADVALDDNDSRGAPKAVRAAWEETAQTQSQSQAHGEHGTEAEHALSSRPLQLRAGHANAPDSDTDCLDVDAVVSEARAPISVQQSFT